MAPLRYRNTKFGGGQKDAMTAATADVISTTTQAWAPGFQTAEQISAKNEANKHDARWLANAPHENLSTFVVMGMEFMVSYTVVMGDDGYPDEFGLALLVGEGKWLDAGLFVSAGVCEELNAAAIADHLQSCKETNTNFAIDRYIDKLEPL